MENEKDVNNFIIFYKLLSKNWIDVKNKQKKN